MTTERFSIVLPTERHCYSVVYLISALRRLGVSDWVWPIFDFHPRKDGTLMRVVTTMVFCLGFTTFSCGTHPNDEGTNPFLPVRTYHPTHFVEASLQNLVDAFHSDMAAAGLTTLYTTQRIEYADLKPTQLGFCEVMQATDRQTHQTIDTWRVITISRKLPPESPLTKATVYHELTHCEFGVGHSTYRYSIMYPTLDGSDEFWESTWATRLEELVEDIKATTAQY